MKSKNKKIIFEPVSDYIDAVNEPPIPVSKKIPDWYKSLNKFIGNSDKPIKALGRKDLKSCVPFRDAMITGYLILSPADIEVCISHTGDVDIFQNRSLNFNVVDKRGPLIEGNQGFGMPNPLGTVPIMFAWTALWGIETPKSHSVLITHPLNRNDLPFITTSGIIDSGYFTKAGNIPFFIKEGFAGIIPKGTPIAQVIPFKREGWNSEIKEADQRDYAKVMTLRDSYLSGFYSRFLRQPKTYN